MKRKPSRKLETAFSESPRALDQNRLSTSTGKPISEKVHTSPLNHPSNEHIASSSDHATPSLLTDEDVCEFQKLYKVRFGKDITYEEAYEQGVKLVRLLELIYTPMTLDEYQRLQRHRRDDGRS